MSARGRGAQTDGDSGSAAGATTEAPTRTSPVDRSLASRLREGGVDGNGRLTTQTGLLLIVMLAVLGVTIIRIGQLLWLHLFLGLVLIGPVALKLASTGYRFVRYYTFEPRYRHRGPPAIYMRLTAPLLVLSTLVVFASGVALLLLGPSSRSTLLLVHKASFIAWLAITSFHVLCHLPDLQRELGSNRATRTILLKANDRRASRPARLDAVGAVPGEAGRGLSLLAACVAGLAIAIGLLSRYGAWLHYRHHMPHVH